MPPCAPISGKLTIGYEQSTGAGEAVFQGGNGVDQSRIKLGKFKPFEGDSDFMPGFKGISTPGHTPGHTSYVAQSKGQRMVF